MKRDELYLFKEIEKVCMIADDNDYGRGKRFEGTRLTSS